MPTITELAAELGIPAETVASKPEVIAKWNGYFTDAETKTANAQKKLQDAQALQAVIDENIKNFGMTEANVAQLQASNAAYKAALDEVKKAGFTGINLPDLGNVTPPAADPVKDLTNLITRGFSQMGDTMNAQNRYQRVFGKPLPEDPATLADRAAQKRMSVSDYVESTYGVSAEEQKQVAATRQKELDDYAATKLKAYQESNPSVAGHPELNGGLPSNFAQMPKPRDSKSVREFAGMSTREKIANALTRANQAAKPAMA